MKSDIILERRFKPFTSSKQKITSYIRKRMESISALFGKESFQTLQLPSKKVMNDDRYEKLVKMRHYKECYMYANA